MQMAATDAFDISQEPQYVRDAYGPGVQARQLLIARRLIERGVRFVQLYHGDVQPWDAHDHIAENHRTLAGQCDRAIAALLADLKQRGLFEETLVLCGGEFGRTPAVEMVNGKPAMGRDHNHWGFSVWLAGGGVKGGIVHGATDEFGYQAVEKPGPRPRPARHDPPPPRLRPHPAHLPIRRPRLPPHRRARRGRARDSNMIGES